MTKFVMTQCASVCLLVIFGKSQLFVGYHCLLISNQAPIFPESFQDISHTHKTRPHLIMDGMPLKMVLLSSRSIQYSK